jgi:hypothetical protein
MKKEYIIGIAGLIVLIFAFTDIGGVDVTGRVQNTPTYSNANTSSVVTVGPQENVRVVATTSRRSYLRLQAGTGIADAYCEAQADAPATSGEGIMIGTTTSATYNVYEFTADKGNLYTGSLRCTASASTTLLVTEFSD